MSEAEKKTHWATKDLHVRSVEQGRWIIKVELELRDEKNELVAPEMVNFRDRRDTKEYACTDNNEVMSLVAFYISSLEKTLEP